MRLLWLGAEVLILDEPTHRYFSFTETAIVCHRKKLSKQGKSVIFVSHKLEEVEMLCSQVDVFRAGKNVGRCGRPLKRKTG